MWQQLVEKVLGGLKLAGAKALLHQLITFAEPYAAKEVARGASWGILHGLNTAIAAAVNSLDKESAGKFAHAYVEAIDQEIDQFMQALTAYIPLQFAVEEARKEFGAGSDQEAAALKNRQAGVDSFSQDISELLAKVMPSE